MNLEARGIKVHFDGVKAVDGVDLTLRRGEILGLIGPNGAGKTTLVDALSGFQPLTAGQVTIAEVPATGLAPHRLARLGVARTFQGVRSFSSLTVLENVAVAAVSVGVRRQLARDRAWEILEGLQLGTRWDVQAGTLPAGDERRLGIGRALATGPRFLLLDEPAAGLNDDETVDLTNTLAEIRSTFSCALLVIEHDMEVIMSLCEKVQVLDYGRTIAIGTPAEIQRSDAVLTAYLGSERTADAAIATG